MEMLLQTFSRALAWSSGDRQIIGMLLFYDAHKTGEIGWIYMYIPRLDSHAFLIA